jgi:hypothetical protein
MTASDSLKCWSWRLFPEKYGRGHETKTIYLDIYLFVPVGNGWFCLRDLSPGAGSHRLV